MSRYDDLAETVISEDWPPDLALILATISSLEKTGAVDQDAPHFAKVIAHAAMRDALERNRLITPEGKRDLKNLSHF